MSGIHRYTHAARRSCRGTPAEQAPDRGPQGSPADLPNRERQAPPHQKWSACWPIGLGFTPEGHKRAEGDGRTPEGLYATSDKPWSQYYAAIAVHYPGAEDARAGERDARISPGVSQRIQRALAANKKPPQRTPLGGEILIHGGGSASDWTLGCVAMDNAHIDALRATLPNDMVTEVLILP